MFLASFRGLKSKENAVQYPEKTVRISFAEKSAAKVFTLDYLGDVRQLGAEREGGRLSCVLPQLDKGAVVWTE